MMRRSLIRAARARGQLPHTRRWLSDKPEPPAAGPKPDKQTASRSRLDRFVERTPRFLRPTVTGLRQAPFSHVAAFFILHELTAIIPLLGLAGAFHYWQWLPPYFAEGAWISAGVEKFGRYFRKKGWITENEENTVEEETEAGNARHFEEQRGAASKWFNGGGTAAKWVVELATAYAIVKVLLPMRIFVSVWGAPWFAQVAVLPIRNTMRTVIRMIRPPLP